MEWKESTKFNQTLCFFAGMLFVPFSFVAADVVVVVSYFYRINEGCFTEKCKKFIDGYFCVGQRIGNFSSRRNNKTF
jgi:hypothetical protein